MDNLIIKFIEDYENSLSSNNSIFSKNCNHLFGNVFLVRTQAGLKNAVKRYAAVDETDLTTFKSIVEYLRFQNTLDFSNIKYPLIIEFVPIYLGFHGTEFFIKELEISKESVSVLDPK